ncbi:hypothetical protein MmiHf6_13090 [Methanimicrococcus hongohii]|uniref:Uncharacterized protein n=1 Tax=Methanimicrococcus hongohii TaxID=3028295 RepID=A0AA96V0D4_9EURY|nr:hypothetical protein [Methanimicrococcus sp. Hf6]WNY23984.1 hypothetical protein MmiHf6_13090 [Methanimicrococcus sp. Hf6]
MQSMQNISTKETVNKTTIEKASFGAPGTINQTKITIARLFMLASIFGLAWLVTAL